ncbi:MAG: tetratricopeptide (TPR) repeat protein [Bacteroidia bacterium]|jgi:tetratricopeptide (TPR) repeat protein
MKYFCASSVTRCAHTVLKRINRYIPFVFLAFGLVLLAGCSTKKKNFLSRGFHNVTAKYNVYWNGKEAMKAGVDKLEKSHSDNYEEILDVFPVGTSESAKSVYGDMDRGIEKASLTIAKHSMLIKGKEYVASIDDSYMLIGKAHFYKRDYVLALEMFSYVVKQYKKNQIRFDGYLWLIRVNTELARFKDGEKIILLLEEEKKFPKKKLAELAAVKADYYIKKGDFEQAKDQLILAIDATKQRKSKARYTYILAQLYEEINNTDSAAYYFAKVLKKNVPYVMEFNARINRALLASAESGDIGVIKKELIKMAKDDKNTDYFDRIYYALGDIALDEGEKDLALGYLKKSVAATTKNITQKAISYYTIADLYFDKPEYENASAYYDSSLAILPVAHKQYSRVQARQQSLAELVKNIKVIALQDSLLELSNMSDLELDSYLAEMIETLAEAEEERLFEEANKPSQQQQLNQLNQTSGGLATTGSGWYFYNTTALSFGANDFRQKWGDRKREDNWRRKSKRSTNVNQIMDEEGGGDTTQATTAQLLDPEFYKKDIPKTEGARDSANLQIQDALYDLGTIYKEQLSENQRATESFEELLRRYPNGKWNLETFYQLYRLHKAVGDELKAQDYANKIFRDFPDSEYAKILRDPKYLEKLEIMRGKLGQMYDMAFTNFEAQEYERVIEAADSALTKFNDDDILSKFALLKVMAIGATEKLAVYRKALEDYIAKYTAAPEKPRAEDLLEYVKGLMGETLEDESQEGEATKTEQGKEESKEEEVKAISSEVYLLDKEANHYYAIVVTNLPDVSEMKGRVSNFNSEFFSQETLTIKNLQFSPTEDLIFVNGFKKTKKAMDYYNAILADTTVFAGIDLQTTNQFVISQENFGRFYQEKEVPPYVQFFITNYILKKD